MVKEGDATQAMPAQGTAEVLYGSSRHFLFAVFDTGKLPLMTAASAAKS
jgi:hypothetical protein